MKERAFIFDTKVIYEELYIKRFTTKVLSVNEKRARKALNNFK